MMNFMPAPMPNRGAWLIGQVFEFSRDGYSRLLNIKICKLINFLLFCLLYALIWKFYCLFSKFVYISLVNCVDIDYARYALFIGSQESRENWTTHVAMTSTKTHETLVPFQYLLFPWLMQVCKYFD